MKKLIVIILMLIILTSSINAYEVDRVWFYPKKDCSADLTININDYTSHSDKLVELIFPAEIDKKTKPYYSPTEGRLYFPGIKVRVDIKEQDITCFDNKKTIEMPSPKSQIKYIVDNQIPERLNIESKAAYGIVVYEKPQNFQCDGNAILSIKNIHLSSPNKCNSFLYPFDNYFIEFGFNFDKENVAFIVDDKEIQYENYEMGIFSMNESSFLSRANVIDFSKYNNEDNFLNMRIRYQNDNWFIQLVFILLMLFFIAYILLSFTLWRDNVFGTFSATIPLIFEVYFFVFQQNHIVNLFDLVLIMWVIISLIKVLIYFITNKCREVRLNIKKLNKPQDLKVYTFVDTGWIRKFANLHVENSSQKTAKRCIATLRVLEKPKKIRHLEREYPIHWAGVNYSTRTTGAEPVDFGKEIRRLDIAFTHKDLGSGCWIAIPIALLDPSIGGQAYLPPGSYKIEVEVSCENGKGSKKQLLLKSPKKWDKLDISEISD